MIQRNKGRRRWKSVVWAASLGLSVAIGVAAAQQPPAQPPPVQMKVQIGGAIVPAGGQIIIGGGQPGGQSKSENGTTERVKLPVDPRARRKMEEAQRYIETQDWQSAVKILQSLLDGNEDNFLQESDSEKGRRVSVRAEATRLLGNLPREGKLFYEQQFGSQAKLALKQAKAQSNPQALADVALRYVHTEAGAEAAALLGSYHLDHGRYIVAALCFERLLAREGGSELPAPTLYKAAVAFERAGDKASRDRAWALLQARMNQANGKLPTALRSWDEAKLRAALGSNLKEREELARTDWPLFMGSPDRTARSGSGMPFLEQRLPPYEPVVATATRTQPEDAGRSAARAQVEEASKKLAQLGVPVIPGSHPIVVRNLVVFRTLDGIHAFDLKAGQVAWYSTSDAALASMASSSTPSDQDGMNFVVNYAATAPVVLTENTLLGTLSADQELVYAVEDLALPRMSYAGMVGGFGRGMGGGMPQIGNKLSDYNGCNHLTAYDIEGGRAVWSIGTRIPDQPFSDTYFLGPPLPVGDKLYVLGESHGEIKLFCLQNRRTPKPGQQGEYQYSVELVWAQPLGLISQQPIAEDPVRRTQAAMLSYSDGILVCPTNAGSVIGVDLLTRSLIWAYNYQTESISPEGEGNVVFLGGGRFRRFPGDTGTGVNTTQWSFSAPVISGGKVFLAPPDGKALHVLHLRDGSLAWTANRVETGKDAAPPDQYLAGVFDGKVLLVGKQSVRALDVNTGKQLWRTPTGIPVGRGVASESTYYLPVRRNELLSISVSDGKILSRSKALQKESFGNLTLVGDEFLSVNHTHLLVYPTMAVKERQIAARLSKDPNDPVGLIERGEFRWHRVGLEEAIADFEQALLHDPLPAVRTKGESKLVEAMLILLDQDFAKHESYLNRLGGLIMRDAPTDAKPDEKETVLERKSRFLRVVALGREAQGRIGEALDALVTFSRLDTKLIPSPEDAQTKVLPLVWARGKAETLAKRLKPEWRPQLAAAVQKVFDRVKVADNAEALKNFVDFYGGLGPNGQQATLRFAEKLVDQREFAMAQIRLLSLIEAEDAAVAARAIDLLARLNLRQSELENTAYYYQLLGKRYPDVPIRDGKTGLQLYRELMNDKRFLPYLDPQRGMSGLREVTIEKVAAGSPVPSGRERNYGGMSYGLHFEPARPVPPSLRRYELHVHVDMQGNSSSKYVLVDQTTQKEILSKTTVALPIANWGTMQKQAQSYQPCGPVMIFAWSNRVVALDPAQKKELWTLNLLGDQDANVGMGGYSIGPHPELPGRFQMYTMGMRETLGTVGPGSSLRVVATVKDVGLVGLDPLTGERVWVRGGISTNTELFGDDEYVIVMPPPGASKEEQAFGVRLLDGDQTTLAAEVIEQYQKRLAVRGRFILTRSSRPEGESLALVDPLGPTEKWRIPLPGGSVVITDADENALTGYVTPAGEVYLHDLADGKELRRLKMTALGPDVKYEQAHVAFDAEKAFVFLCKEMKDKELKETDKDGNLKQLFPQYQWLRSVAVNGPAAAFERTTGKLLWQETLPLQYLVVRRFDELPVLLCSAMVIKSKEDPNGPARAIRRAAPNVIMAMRGGRLEHEVTLLSKQTGKPLPYEGKPVPPDYSFERQGYGGYYSLIINPATSIVGLKSTNRTLTLTLKPKTVASK